MLALRTSKFPTSFDRTTHVASCHVTGPNFMSLDQKRHSIGPAACLNKFVSQIAFTDTCVAENT